MNFAELAFIETERADLCVADQDDGRNFMVIQVVRLYAAGITARIYAWQRCFVCRVVAVTFFTSTLFFSFLLFLCFFTSLSLSLSLFLSFDEAVKGE